LALLSTQFGIAGYIAPIVVMTASYALFQAANNTAVMADAQPDQRGVIAGLLSLSRNLGLITGASVMGALFAVASAASDLTTAQPASVATGMRTTFAVAALVILAALAIAGTAYRRAPVRPASGRESAGGERRVETPRQHAYSDGATNAGHWAGSPQIRALHDG